MEERLALWGGVVPGVIAGVTLLALWVRHARRTRDGKTASVGPVWAMPILILVALVLGTSTQNGWPTLWPDDNTYRYPHAAALVCALGLVEALVALPVLVAFVARAFAFAGVYWMLVEGYHPHAVPTPDFYGWMAVTALGGAGIATALEQAGAVLTRWRMPVVLVVVFAGAAGVTLNANFASVVHLATPMIAVMTAAAIVGACSKTLTLARGAGTCVAGVVIVVVLGAGFQSEALSVPALVLVALAPVATLAALAFRARPTVGFGAAVVSTIVVLALAGGAVYLAQPTPDPDDPYTEYAG